MPIAGGPASVTLGAGPFLSDHVMWLRQNPRGKNGSRHPTGNRLDARLGSAPPQRRNRPTRRSHLTDDRNLLAGIVRVNSILPARAPRRVEAPLFLLTNHQRARPDSTPKIAYTYLP